MTNKQDMAALSRLEALLADCSPGPWSAHVFEYAGARGWTPGTDDDWFITDGASNLGGSMDKSDALAIAELRNTAPALIEVARLADRFVRFVDTHVVHVDDARYLFGHLEWDELRAALKGFDMWPTEREQIRTSDA
jgi:hypothetical protein